MSNTNKDVKIKRISAGLLILAIINASLFGLAILIRLANGWVLRTFDDLSPDKIIFHLKVPLKGSGHALVFDFINRCVILPALIVAVLVCAYVIYRFWKYKRYLRTNDAMPYSKRYARIIHLVILLVALCTCVFEAYHFLDTYGFVEYIRDSMTEERFIDDNYVDYKKANVVFPEEKRNLLFIFLESMETTFASRELGGALETNIIPELTDLAMDNITFSDSDYPIGGSRSIFGTGWTIGSMVAHQAGIPLKVPIDINSLDAYETFLPGVTVLGDILHDEGYRQTLLVGSNSVFGGRYAFYRQHGKYDIFDYYTALEAGLVDDYVFWGYDDKTLYKHAKMELLDLASKDKPFNLTMLTVDTHHIGGYTCELCTDEHDIPYWNVFSCASRQLTEFITWVQQQDFYENTSIVIVGDHPSMDPIVKETVGEDYIRRRYNVFINSSVTSENTKNRQYTPFDIYPTTLASMGVKIKGDRLALGVNLFSDVPTLMETYGYEEVQNGLEGKSIKYMTFY